MWVGYVGAPALLSPNLCGTIPGWGRTSGSQDGCALGLDDRKALVLSTASDLSRSWGSEPGPDKLLGYSALLPPATFQTATLLIPAQSQDPASQESRPQGPRLFGALHGSALASPAPPTPGTSDCVVDDGQPNAPPACFPSRASRYLQDRAVEGNEPERHDALPEGMVHLVPRVRTR